MKRIWAIIAMTLAAGALAGCGDSVVGPDDFTFPPGSGSSDFQWQGLVARGDRIEIKGINGEIRAIATSGSEVQVTAIKTGGKYPASEVKIQVVEHAEGVTICARYPNASGHLSPCAPVDTGFFNMRLTDVHVAFTVKVPEGVVFVGRTVNGDVRATDLRSDAFASTVNGNIGVSTDGLAEGFTVNGSITASIGRANWGRDLRFATVHGSVALTIPADTDAWVDGSTMNGEASTDFPLTIRRHGSFRSMRGTLGNGGWTLALATLSGNISLMRGP